MSDREWTMANPEMRTVLTGDGSWSKRQIEGLARRVEYMTNEEIAKWIEDNPQWILDSDKTTSAY